MMMVVRADVKDCDHFVLAGTNKLNGFKFSKFTSIKTQ
jgi:hypothetical protein